VGTGEMQKPESMETVWEEDHLFLPLEKERKILWENKTMLLP
jgi:hypothetical protein